MSKPRIICGFPGVGKSTLYRDLSKKGIPILDSDSSTFDKAGFPENYLQHLKEADRDGYIVLCSTHHEVRVGLARMGIHYSLVAPMYREQKMEYLKRYTDRGSPASFVRMMDEKWDQFFDDVWDDEYARHVGLRPGQYLVDVMSELV